MKIFKNLEGAKAPPSHAYHPPPTQNMFNEMHVYGQFPILSTYTVMLSGLCKNGHIEEAIDLFHSLENTKYKPSIELFSILIDGMCKAGTLEEARKMFTEISERGLMPDVVTYNIMLSGLCKKSMSLEADKLLMEMEEKGCLPDSISFNILPHGISEYTLRSFKGRMFLNSPCSSRTQDKGHSLFPGSYGHLYIKQQSHKEWSVHIPSPL